MHRVPLFERSENIYKINIIQIYVNTKLTYCFDVHVKQLVNFLQFSDLYLSDRYSVLLRSKNRDFCENSKRLQLKAVSYF